MERNERATSSATGLTDSSQSDLARAWRVLARIHGDPVCLCPHTGEAWQYLGQDEGEFVFRHRSLNGRRVYERIAARVW